MYFVRYSVTDCVWSKIETTGDKPSARHNHTAVMYKDTLYIFGGSGFAAAYYNDIFAFNFETAEWRKVVPSTPSPVR
jgi:N-acetylneuraminic acid mutarotase